jgi:hypothetical protein
MSVELDPEEAKHAVRVLRLHTGKSAGSCLACPVSSAELHQISLSKHQQHYLKPMHALNMQRSGISSRLTHIRGLPLPAGVDAATPAAADRSGVHVHMRPTVANLQPGCFWCCCAIVLLSQLPGDLVELCDGRGGLVQCELAAASKSSAMVSNTSAVQLR